jgi:hypothetical protein
MKILGLDSTTKFVGVHRLLETTGCFKRAVFDADIQAVQTQ